MKRQNVASELTESQTTWGDEDEERPPATERHTDCFLATVLGIPTEKYVHSGCHCHLGSRVTHKQVLFKLRFSQYRYNFFLCQTFSK